MGNGVGMGVSNDGRNLKEPSAPRQVGVQGSVPLQNRISASPLRRFLKFVKPYRHLVFLMTLCGVLRYNIPLVFPWAFKILIDDILINPDRDTPQKFHTLLLMVWGLVGVYLVHALATFGRSYWAGKVGQRVIFDFRYQLYLHLQRLSLGFYQSHRTGSVVTRIINDIQIAQNFVGSAITNVLMDVTSLLTTLGILFYLNRRMAAVSLLIFPVYIASMIFFSRKLRRLTFIEHSKMEEISGDLHEKIAGIEVVQSFTRERVEARNFFHKSTEYFRLVLRKIVYSSAANTTTDFLTSIAPVIVLAYGGKLVLEGRLSPGAIVAFYVYLRQLYDPINRLTELNHVLQTSLAAMERVFEFFDILPEVSEIPQAKPIQILQGEIVFKEVSFAYEKQKGALHGINLHVAPGEVIALVGRSGAGKSSLVKLIPRFYDPVKGDIFIDGYNLKEVSLKSLRRQVGMVLQENVLFSGTLWDNIRMGNPGAPPEAVVAAAKAAHIHDFILSLPRQYQTEVGERGVHLSGGQKQRIALARAFLKNPRILILDEATSALDSESENLIQEALKKLMRGRTTFIIAHRLSTVMSASRIVVLEQGRIVEMGTHKELLALRGLYARLYYEQFKETFMGGPLPMIPGTPSVVEGRGAAPLLAGSNGQKTVNGEP